MALSSVNAYRHSKNLGTRQVDLTFVPSNTYTNIDVILVTAADLACRVASFPAAPVSYGFAQFDRAVDGKGIFGVGFKRLADGTIVPSGGKKYGSLLTEMLNGIMASERTPDACGEQSLFALTKEESRRIANAVAQGLSAAQLQFIIIGSCDEGDILIPAQGGWLDATVRFSLVARPYDGTSTLTPLTARQFTRVRDELESSLGTTLGTLRYDDSLHASPKSDGDGGCLVGMADMASMAPLIEPRRSGFKMTLGAAEYVIQQHGLEYEIKRATGKNAVTVGMYGEMRPDVMAKRIQSGIPLSETKGFTLLKSHMGIA